MILSPLDATQILKINYVIFHFEQLDRQNSFWSRNKYFFPSSWLICKHLCMVDYTGCWHYLSIILRLYLYLIMVELFFYLDDLWFLPLLWGDFHIKNLMFLNFLLCVYMSCKLAEFVSITCSFDILFVLIPHQIKLISYFVRFYITPT